MRSPDPVKGGCVGAVEGGCVGGVEGAVEGGASSVVEVVVLVCVIEVSPPAAVVVVLLQITFWDEGLQLISKYEFIRLDFIIIFLSRDVVLADINKFKFTKYTQPWSSRTNRQDSMSGNPKSSEALAHSGRLLSIYRNTKCLLIYLLCFHENFINNKWNNKS